MRTRFKTFITTFVLAALVAVKLAIVLRRAAPSAPTNLKVTFLGYTNLNYPMFQLTNPSSRSLQVGWFITQEGQAFGSIALHGLPDGLLAPHKTFTFVIPPPLCGHPWRAQFVAEPVGWEWNDLKMRLGKRGLPVGASEMSFGGSSEVIVE